MLIRAVRNKYNNEDVTELEENLDLENYEKSFEVLQQIIRRNSDVPKSD